MKKFYAVWTAQFVAILGNGLTGFALGLWALEHTGTVSAYTGIAFLVSMPMLLLAPFIGVLVDRFDRRNIMLTAELGQILYLISMSLLYWQELLNIWVVLPFVAISSVCSACYTPALQASVSLMVNEKHLGRASGMLQLSGSVAMLIAPVAAAFLMSSIGFGGILTINIFAVLTGIIILLTIRIPRPANSKEEKERPHFFKDALFGFKYIWLRSAMLKVVLFLSAVTVVTAMFQILVVPMVLGFTDKKELGLVMSFAGVGTLLGALGMAVTGGLKQKINGAFIGALGVVVGVLIAAIFPHWIAVSSGVLITLFSMSIAGASTQAIWFKKVEPEVQGRVFASVGLIRGIAGPFSFLLAGPLSDYLFGPLMMPQGILANSVGIFIGVGEGRGIAFLFILSAICLMLILMASFLSRSVRSIEMDECWSVESK